MSKKYLSEADLAEILARSDSEEDFSDESDRSYLSGNIELENDFLSDSDVESSGNTSSKSQPPPKKQKTEDYKWRAGGTFVPKQYDFDNSTSGCKHSNLNSNSTELECFQIYFTEDIMRQIADECNKYFVYLSSKETILDQSRLKRWKDTNYEELYCFLAVTILMPQVKKLKVNDYWASEFLISTPSFSQIMQRDRYLLLLRLLHFADNIAPPIATDPLRKIRIIVDHLRNAFKQYLNPFQNVCIDESLLLFKGRIFFKQYIPSKRHRFGVKFFLLCDCETGYILDFIVYTGATTQIEDFGEPNLGKSGNVVLTLMTPYLNRGHCLYVDNWYTSPALFSYLHRNKTNACGTVKANRKSMPQMNKKLNQGQTEHQCNENMLAIKWHDKRDVRMLNTMHSNEMVTTDKIDRKSGETIVKPQCVVEYNKNMGAVDKTDLLLSSIETVRKTVKWYKKVFFHLVDLTVLNACVLHKVLTGKNTTVAEYQLNLVKQLLNKYHKALPRKGAGRRSENADSPLRLTERHFPACIPPTQKKCNPTKRCVVCATKNQRKETRYMCDSCDVALCVIPCFKNYHTLKKY